MAWQKPQDLFRYNTAHVPWHLKMEVKLNIAFSRSFCELHLLLLSSCSDYFIRAVCLSTVNVERATNHSCLLKPIERIHAIIRHTDKHLGLIMTLFCSLLNSAKLRVWTDRQMDGHYQLQYLPGLRCYVVNNKVVFDAIMIMWHILFSTKWNNYTHNQKKRKMESRISPWEECR